MSEHIHNAKHEKVDERKHKFEKGTHRLIGKKKKKKTLRLELGINWLEKKDKPPKRKLTDNLNTENGIKRERNKAKIQDRNDEKNQNLAFFSFPTIFSVFCWIKYECPQKVKVGIRFWEGLKLLVGWLVGLTIYECWKPFSVPTVVSARVYPHFLFL